MSWYQSLVPSVPSSSDDTTRHYFLVGKRNREKDLKRNTDNHNQFACVVIHDNIISLISKLFDDASHI